MREIVDFKTLIQELAASAVLNCTQIRNESQEKNPFHLLCSCEAAIAPNCPALHEQWF